MITPEFKESEKRLNLEQRKAVETIDGPVMVIAGPGTGKTEILTLRIANILLKTDTRPEQILALTFTESAALNMRKRLESVIGAPAYRVRIKTFHSFCNDILQSYPEYFPAIVGSKNISEVESAAIIEEIIKNADLTVLRPWGEPLLYVGDCIRKIEELKREGLNPEDFDLLVDKQEKDYKKRNDLYHEKGAYKGRMKSEHVDYLRRIEKNKELALVYCEYQKKLREKKLYDYSDMIIEVLNALRDKKLKDLKLTLQEEHQYILVDEHQDTNNAQNQILEILCDFHESPNIFVVGDHKQAIFRFQGASVENFLHFKKLYPEAELIELFRNYRSNQVILDSAESIIKSEKSLKSENKIKIEKIILADFTNENTENYWIAEQIKKLEGNAAVIYRTNKEAFGIAAQLEKASIDFVIDSDEDILADRYVRKLLNVLYAVNFYGDDIYLSAALHVEELGLDPLEAYKLIRSAHKSKKQIYDSLPTDIGKKFKNWVIKAKELELPHLVELIFRESGIFESALKDRDAEAFLGIDRIFEEAKRMSGARRGAALADFIEYLNVLKNHNILIKRPKYDFGERRVHLMTAHKAKGLEFDNVFIIHSSEKSFGLKNIRDRLPLINLKASGPEKNDLEDERRLFYVALTRARKRIFITHHQFDIEGKELLLSPFIAEIKKELVEKVDTTKFKVPKEKLYARSPKRIREIDKEFVENLFYKEQLSVTALNNYLDCPWKYFYRNLVRVPYVQAKYLLYGTAMHAAVEEFFRMRQKGHVTKEFLLESFEKHLKEAGMSEMEEKDALKRGQKSLSVWYEERKNSWLLPYQLEMNIWGVKFENILLSGKLDKIEFVDDMEVVVTDYKTGKIKSRNEIEGKTRDATGDMKRQLVFYKLLLNLYDGGKLNMTRGIIEFLEPNDSGRIKWEEFEIGKEEVEELKKTIKRVAKEITTLSFWDKFCDDPECEYCAYRRLLEGRP